MTKDEWKELPATPDQLHALRKLASESGRTFSIGISRGRAWQRINRATRILSPALRKRCAPPIA